MVELVVQAAQQVPVVQVAQQVLLEIQEIKD
jgi:hypothetical protein